MSDTLFIQFYSKTKSGWFDLCNGFSDTYDLCQSKGDFLWMEHEADNDKWYEEPTYQNRLLPIQKGRVYVSASYVNHLYQAYTWATLYPDIEFIVGGPVASERCVSIDGWNSVHFKVEKELPSNLFLTGQSVEDLFKVPNFSGKWKFKVPGVIPRDSRIYFSYTLENMCYWKKCPFCSIAQQSTEHFRKREKIDLEFLNFDFQGHKIVRLNTGSIMPEHIKAILPRLPNLKDIEYRFFMRAAKAETNALKQVIKQLDQNVPDCTIGFGIEFPSDRMWKYLNKGTKMDEVFETLELCRKSGFKVNANVILGWNNLIEQDLKDLEHFMDTLSENAVTTLQLRWLFAHPYTKIHENYDGVQNSIKLGPFNCGFNVRVNEKQKTLNMEAAKIIKEKCGLKKIKLEGYKNLSKGMI
ncbi:MAG: radical SAM protein [Pseudomonadota bacterium]